MLIELCRTVYRASEVREDSSCLLECMMPSKSIRGMDSGVEAVEGGGQGAAIVNKARVV